MLIHIIQYINVKYENTKVYAGNFNVIRTNNNNRNLS